MADSQRGLVAARVVGAGRSRRRLLVIGDRSMVVAGATAPPALVTLSSALAVRGQRPTGGVDLDVLWDLLPAIRAVTEGSGSWPRRRYDAVIVVLPAPGARSARTDRLLLRALSELARTGPLLVVVPHGDGRDADRRATGRRSHHLLHRLTDAGHPVPALSAAVDGEGCFTKPVETAEAVLELLDRAPMDGAEVRRRRTGPQSEAERQEAVDRSVHALGGITSDLMRVVLLARNTFDMPYAQINLVSGGRLHSVAFAGRSSHALTGTLSAMVVRGTEALLIEDTHTDSRCAGIEETVGPDAIRCYVGHPIESVDGYRIGTLCVFDTAPHPIDEDDDVLIRDLALLAEAEINALTPAD